MTRPTLVSRPEMTRDEWAPLFSRCVQAPLSQSWAYNSALGHSKGWLARYYLIEQAGAPLGGCVIQRHHAGPLQAIRIERGPIWLTQPDSAQQAAILDQLAALTRPGLLGRRRFYPALSHGKASDQLLVRIGFRTIQPGYQTIWLDLTGDMAERRRQIRANWRNHLNRAERSPLEISIDRDGTHLPWLSVKHTSAMRQRHYAGPSADLLLALARETIPAGDYLGLVALYHGKPVAGTLFIRHGQSATYLVSWSGKLGRQYRAHNRLIWQSLDLLGQAGCRMIDLGGINPTSAAGVTDFKRGLLCQALGDREITDAPVCR